MGEVFADRTGQHGRRQHQVGDQTAKQQDAHQIAEPPRRHEVAEGKDTESHRHDHRALINRTG